MQRSRINPLRRAKQALVCGLGLVLLSHAGLAVLLEDRHPELRDPEYGARLQRLRTLRSEHPESPFLIVIGSSRTAWGFAPDAVAAYCTTPAPRPVIANFSLLGAGPVMELVLLNRLLTEGIRPSWVVVEITPSFLLNEGPWSEQVRFPASRLGWRDLRLLESYWPGSAMRRGEWWDARLSPWFANRFAIVGQTMPSLLHYTRQQLGIGGMDHWGWQPWQPTDLDEKASERRSEAALHMGSDCYEHFRISVVSDLALRAVAALCRREQIALVFLLMPEGSAYRACCTSDVSLQLNAWLERLGQEEQVPIIDARCWAADDAFHDTHHLLPAGARAFSERLGQSILLPWIAGTWQVTGPGLHR